MLTFIINSKIPRLKSVCRTLESKFANNEFLLTEYAGHTIELASKITGQERTVVAVGGDGTINEVLNGIMQTTRSDRPAIAIYPVGSANDFATAQNISIQNLNHANDQSSTFRSIDIGLIEYVNSRKFFINVADAGFGAEVVRSLTNKRFLGSSFSYFRAITSTFFRYKPVEMHVESPNFSWSGKAYGVFVANSSQLGSGIKIDPNAKIDDGIFTVFVVGELSGLEYLLEVNRLKRGKPPKSSKIQSFECSELSINSTAACSIEADGELIGKLPVKIAVQPGEVRLRYL